MIKPDSLINLIAFATMMLLYSIGSYAQVQCLQCHDTHLTGLNKHHQFSNQVCASCHLGNELASDKHNAHQGMVISPGNLSNAPVTCAACHADHVNSVLGSVMHTGSHIVSTTRAVLEPAGQQGQGSSLQTLGHGLADSMLRKLCASCHLGHERKPGKPNAVMDRGGGCLACHLNEVPEVGHPALTVQVEDARCFGCHSRSGRISLNYAGLAEVDTATAIARPQGLGRLPDGRVVSHQPSDTHHAAGMACIDCHTGIGLMGIEKANGVAGIDISCRDCHDNQKPRLPISDWPEQYISMLDRVPFSKRHGQSFIQTSNGTPLIHIDANAKDLLLYPKLGGKPLKIPQITGSHMPLASAHGTLTCDTCHASWVPTCLGCHMRYQEDGKQWDHSLSQMTAGVWHEKRWAITAGQATLGKRDAETVDTFLPGMIMSVEHPELDDPVFIRRFARLSPHTTGKARTCEGCHRSSVALGLGKGELLQSNGRLQFLPEMQPLVDGLPADAWTAADGVPDKAYPRALSGSEMERLYKALDNQSSTP
jgi:hypothetical protein